MVTTIKDKKAFVENFVELLADGGDMLFSSGAVEQDYYNITTTIKNQGYWAGNGVRYFFDKNWNFEGVQERMFGVS